jgi:hypothetical protein
MQSNMSEQSTPTGADKDNLPPPTRGQRLAAFGFLGAFGLTILTVLLTGLSVGAPSTRHLLQPGSPAAETNVPSAKPTVSPASPRLGSAASAAPPPNVGEPHTDENASTDDAAPDRDDATREHSRTDSRKAGESRDSRANDAR